MDLNFHYYAVKTVARAAGYNEEQAQRIATFSQFVDDYNWYAYFKANNIPEYMKEPDMDFVFNEATSLINPVTTGFTDIIDMATLIKSRAQEFIVSAFHFIPCNAQSVQAKDMRTKPATLDDGSYISSELQELKNDITNNNITENDALMRMGMLFHIFADTYAHQFFTGYSTESNSVELTDVMDNITQENVTNKYRESVYKWIEKIQEKTKKAIPTIGHMKIAHVPDLSHLCISFKYTDLNGDLCIHSRNNTSTFTNACKELYMYMRSILGDNNPADMQWEDLEAKLYQGFLIDVLQELEEGEAAAVNKLTPHWSAIFPNYRYTYNSKEIKESFIIVSSDECSAVTLNGEETDLLGKSYSENFYKFNYFADKHLIHLYGKKPRNRKENACDNALSTQILL